MQELKDALEQAVQKLFDIDLDIELTRPEEKFGDYASNLALQLSKQLGHNPREAAEQLAAELKDNPLLAGAEVAGPGFINFKLTDETLWKLAKSSPKKLYEGKTVVAEYSDPNPFKVLHAGHLYTSLVGDVVANLMEKAGATVHRVNFGGDVGLHVGKTMWAIIKELGGEHPEKLGQIPDEEKLDWVSRLYVIGNTAYEVDPQAKDEIIDVNKRVYDLHSADDHDSDFAKIYWTCRQWSYDGFDALYKRLQMKPFEKYYPESTVADLGLATVKEHIGKVYQESEGAVIFKGEDYGLFTQVFINSEGQPTYAAKDVGLIYKKYEDFKPDQSFIFTDIAQKDHLAVVMKSIEQYAPELVKATTHFAHGQIKMAGGVKMSSRKGNILRADDILDAATEAGKQLSGKASPDVVLAAVRYAFIKNRIGGDIIYDPAESVALEGNSGPYLQYAHARAQSILTKAGAEPSGEIKEFEAGERSLARAISEYPEVIARATTELMPHHICTYLYELAQAFNRFYENNRVIDDPRQGVRLSLVQAYADTLKHGLNLLNIAAPDHM